MRSLLFHYLLSQHPTLPTPEGSSRLHSRVFTASVTFACVHELVAMLLRDDPEQPLGQLARDLGVSRVTLWRGRQRLLQNSRTDPQLRTFLETLLGESEL
jgi:hypothetical protein